MRFAFQESGGPEITDNRVLDEWRIPFGDWIEQAVFWVDVELDWLLKIIEWPFGFLIENIVDGWLTNSSFGWIWLVLLVFAAATVLRNVRVGAFSAVALTVCGLLGNAYWIQTARTIGFILVAVILCVIVGIPVGIACGRVDGVWQVVRPILDAMQVVHSFVYMLPFIYFFGIGEESATMVTMVFALPPLIRLTNLGIRQVPADVVEASRAFGAPEYRVLTDVQLPLARPAIMTGLNQTLLLAISMLGIAAIMGAGGLGATMFQALGRQDVAQGAASGLAFFLVAVVLDRISQRDEDDKSFFERLTMAWQNRKTPEALIPEETTAVEAPDHHVERFAHTTAAERRLLPVVIGGALLVIVSTLLTWSSDAGKYSAWARRIDEDLGGESFNGLSASGGSWFGFIALALALFIAVAAAKVDFAPGRGPRWLTTDGAALASIAGMVMMAAYLFGSAPATADGQADGIGAYLAFVGFTVASAGCVLWLRQAAHSPLHPLNAEIAWGRVVAATFGVLLMAAATFSGWSFDTRTDVILTPETEARILELRQEATERPEDAAVIGSQISALMASERNDKEVILDGITDEGTQLGIATFVIGLLAALTTVVAAIFGRHSIANQWRLSTVSVGLGAGAALVAAGWVGTTVRVADGNFVSGIGSFLALCAGLIFVATSLGVLKEFRRSRVYDEIDLSDAAPIFEPTDVDEMVAVG